MKAITLTAAAMLLISVAAARAEQEQVAKAFEHYDAIRSSLAADEIKNIAEHAAVLAPLAEEIAGANAKKAAEGLRTATDLKHAREHFGALSAALVPKFEKAALKDVQIFTCSMVKKTWAQRGTDVQNPYMGKAMLTCGAPAK
jgi:hypothetical protein